MLHCLYTRTRQNIRNLLTLKIEQCCAVADLGGATGGHGPPKRKKKIFFLTVLTYLNFMKFFVTINH